MVSDSSRYMVPGLWSSRGESMTSKFGFYPGNMQEGLASGIRKMTNVIIVFMDNYNICRNFLPNYLLVINDGP